MYRHHIRKRSTKHILHIVPGLGPGGMELAMARIITGLSAEGMRHSIACLKGEPEIQDQLPSATDIYCFHSLPNEPRLPIRLGRLIRRIQPDLIHARNWGAWPDVALGRFLSYPPTPLVYSFHGLGKAGYMPKRRRFASRILVHLTTSLFTVSHQSKTMMVSKWGWPEKTTRVIPNGVDTDQFHPIPRHNSSRFIVGSVGNLRTVKNHALILKACARLVANGADIEVRIAGEGGQREKLTRLAKALNMEDRVFLPGRIEDVATFLNDLDVFVLSSDSEQHPNALNEAMACGIPSIATRVGCVEDLLDQGRCGRIIEPGDEAALTKAIGEYLEDSHLRHSFGEAALSHVKKHYSLEVMIRRYRNLYTDVGFGGLP